MVFKMENKIDSGSYLTYEQLNIIITIGKLWTEISTWFRMYVRALIYDTRNLKAAINNLSDLLSDIYEKLSIFYGTVVAQNIKDLFFDFTTTGMEVAEAIKYGDNVLTDSRVIKWYQTADKIASYLASINIYWDEYQWKYLLYQYIKLRIDDINAVVKGNDQEELETYKELQNIGYLIAMYMGRGIIASMQAITNQ